MNNQNNQIDLTSISGMSNTNKLNLTGISNFTQNTNLNSVQNNQCAVDLKSLDINKNYSDCESTLEFFIISLSKNLNINSKQSVALLSNNKKYLLRLFYKGIKNDFSLTINWLNDINSNIHILQNLMINSTDPKNVSMSFSTLSVGLYSSNIDCVRITNTILSKLSIEIGTDWEWFSNEGYLSYIYGLDKYTIIKNKLVNGLLLHIKGHEEDFIKLLKDKYINEDEENNYKEITNFILNLLPIMNEGFISRLHKTYVIGMNFFFRILYKIVCAFLHESTVKKIKILDGRKDQSMFKEIRKDNIEIDMGGTAPNARIGEENGIFPPRMPSEHFILESQRPEDLLVSEEEYIKKYKNGEINKDLVCPFILDKLEEDKKQQMLIQNNETNNINNEIKMELIQKSKTLEASKSNIINIGNKQEINNDIMRKREEIIIQNRKILIERQQKIQKVKTFMSCKWEFKEDDISYGKYKFNYISHNNIIKDINSLTNKRYIFINNISKISNKKNV